MEAHDENQTLQKFIKYKYSQIIDLKDNFERAKFIISFLEQENSQLKAKQLVMEKEKFKAKKQEMKGKEVVDHEDLEYHEGHVARKRPRTMGLRKALQREREQKPSMEELTFEDRVSMEINEDGDFWLEKINFHLEKLLENANMDNKLQKKRAIHYYTRNHVVKVKIK